SVSSLWSRSPPRRSPPGSGPPRRRRRCACGQEPSELAVSFRVSFTFCLRIPDKRAHETPRFQGLHPYDAWRRLKSTGLASTRPVVSALPDVGISLPADELADIGQMSKSS